MSSSAAFTWTGCKSKPGYHHIGGKAFKRIQNNLDIHLLVYIISLTIPVSDNHIF